MMDNKKETNKIPEKKISKKTLFLLAIVTVTMACVGIKLIYNGWSHETTDDAQIDGDVIPLRTMVSGYIGKICFSDNQKVRKGDTLIIFDTVSLKAQVAQAVAHVQEAQNAEESARKQVSASEFNRIASDFNSGSAKASTDVSKVREWEAEKEYLRIKKMYEEGAASQQSYDNVHALYQEAVAQAAASGRQTEALNEERSVARFQTNIHSIQVGEALSRLKQARAQLSIAEDQYRHAFILAPCNGIVSKKNVEPGQFVLSGTTLACVIDLSGIWVTADFKETQLKDMVTGQAVFITVDAYPGLKINGKVESFCGAADNKFSLLPAENASGNFIKVTQRIPVRISIDRKNCRKLLLPGMNAEVSVKTR